MPQLETRWLVELDGRDPAEVVSDQRELAKLEAADLPDGPHTSARYVVWAAMKRRGLYTGTWPDFNDRDCLEVTNADTDDDQGDEQGLDPGSPTTSGGGSSSW